MEFLYGFVKEKSKTTITRYRINICLQVPSEKNFYRTSIEYAILNKPRNYSFLVKLLL